MSKCNVIDNYNFLLPINIGHVRDILFEQSKEVWENELQTVSKLRTYCTFKDTYTTEPYLYKVHDRHHRSILAQFRCGILPLKVETGRYQSIPIELRLCVLCNENVCRNGDTFYALLFKIFRITN